jgi:hypothetical protein
MGCRGGEGEGVVVPLLALVHTSRQGMVMRKLLASAMSRLPCVVKSHILLEVLLVTQNTADLDREVDKYLASRPWRATSVT